MTTTITATPATTRTTSRAAGIGLWTLQVLLAAIYAFSAFGKLTAGAQNVAGFEAMGLGAPGMYIIGMLELAGAIAMFIPAADRARRDVLRRADDRRGDADVDGRRRGARRDPGDRRCRGRRGRVGSPGQHAPARRPVPRHLRRPIAMPP